MAKKADNRDVIVEYIVIFAHLCRVVRDELQRKYEPQRDSATKSVQKWIKSIMKLKKND